MPLSIESILDTKTLGASVGKAWRLEEALRWREVRGQDGEMTGLWKCRGAGVEGVIGMVFTTQVSSASVFRCVRASSSGLHWRACHRPMQAPRLVDEILTSLWDAAVLTFWSTYRVSTQRTECLSSSSCRISLSRSLSSGLSPPPPPRPTLPLPHRVRHERRWVVANMIVRRVERALSPEAGRNVCITTLGHFRMQKNVQALLRLRV